MCDHYLSPVSMKNIVCRCHKFLVLLTFWVTTVNRMPMEMSHNFLANLWVDPKLIPESVATNSAVMTAMTITALICRFRVRSTAHTVIHWLLFSATSVKSNYQKRVHQRNQQGSSCYCKQRRSLSEVRYDSWWRLGESSYWVYSRVDTVHDGVDDIRLRNRY
jgi:hypothetical protein